MEHTATETKKVKRTRLPSAYNIFVKNAILSMKGKDILPKDKLRFASQMWRSHKEKPVDEVRPAKLDPEVEEPVVVRKKKTISRNNKVVCCPDE